MSERLLQLLDSFRELSVLVVGDAMLDRYAHGGAHRLSPEAPVPVVTVEAWRDCPGGAANAAVNAAALGAKTSLVALLGEDAAGCRLESLVRDHHVAMPAGVAPARATLAKTRVVADAQILVRFDEGTTDAAAGFEERALLTAIAAQWSTADAVVISDYGYGVLTPAVIGAIRELQAASPRILAVDSKSLTAFRELCPTVVKPNYGQALSLLGINGRAIAGDRPASIEHAAQEILEAANARIAAVTLDVDGAVVLQQDGPPARSFARAAGRSQAIGAGDTYLVAFAMTLAAGGNAGEAASLAAAAGQYAADHADTAICGYLELGEHLGRTTGALPGEEQWLGQIRAARSRGQRIVFTNGVFDILHSGHVRYLERARALGDVLIVALNSDASVRRLKGPSRPVNPLHDRAAVLAGLNCVTHVVSFDDDTPERLIRLVQPDIFVKGGDYTRERLVEAPLVEELGGSVVILDYLAEHSTTGIINRIVAGQVPSPGGLPGT